jgi:hypothetical protein
MEGLEPAQSGPLSGNIQCGEPVEHTVSYELSGPNTGMFTRTWSFLLNCVGGIPVSLDAYSSYEGSYYGNAVEREIDGTRTWTWTQLQPNQEERILNGISQRNGERSFNVGNQNTFNWSIQTEAMDVSVNKETHQITGGMVEASGSLIVSNGNSYSFEALIVFNGDGTATVTINGEVYEVELG